MLIVKILRRIKGQLARVPAFNMFSVIQKKKQKKFREFFKQKKFFFDVVGIFQCDI